MKLVTGVTRGWSATLSDDERYRFMLKRPVASPMCRDCADRANADDPCLNNPNRICGSIRRLVSCGLNPSKADAFRDDATVRKEIGFARIWSCDVYIKVNAHGWRATYPDDMWRARASGIDIVGEGNDEAIRAALLEVCINGGIPLAAWGNDVSPERARELARMASDSGVQWMCLGTNKNGSPKHSLYPPYSTPLVPWSPP